MHYMEMLARLGIGSAHPGGFGATVEQLREHPIAQGSRILEVGCGTGRTACYLAKQGYSVTAVDIREDMLAKARRRADREDAAVLFVQGSVEELPLSSESFDVVLAESVTIFTDVPKALAEYARVLRPGGKLYDREILAVKTMTDDAQTAIREFYGVRRLYEEAEWAEMLRAAGFGQAQLRITSGLLGGSWEEIVHYPDLHQEVDSDAYENEAIWETARTYDEIMEAYHHLFGYVLIIGCK